jgi:hypothetical protein
MSHPDHVLCCPFVLASCPTWCGVLETLGTEELKEALCAARKPPPICTSGSYIRCPLFQRVHRQLERAHERLRGHPGPTAARRRRRPTALEAVAIG